MTKCVSVFKLYDMAYRLLDEVTPRRYNCGDLCGSACCKNLSQSSDSSAIPTGMLLLPYEKDYLQHAGANGFSYLCDSSHTDADMVLCHGRCDRRFRPFACRIFPYYVSFDTQNVPSMRLRPDPRAVQICPLVSQRAVKRCAPRFIRHVKEAVRLLSYEPLIREDFLKTAEFLDAMYDFYEKIVQ